MQTSTSGGRSDTEQKALAVMPCTSPLAVSTVTPVAKRPRAARNSSGVTKFVMRCRSGAKRNPEANIPEWYVAGARDYLTHCGNTCGHQLYRRVHHAAQSGRGLRISLASPAIHSWPAAAFVVSEKFQPLPSVQSRRPGQSGEVCSSGTFLRDE